MPALPGPPSPRPPLVLQVAFAENIGKGMKKLVFIGNFDVETDSLQTAAKCVGYDVR